MFKFSFLLHNGLLIVYNNELSNLFLSSRTNIAEFETGKRAGSNHTLRGYLQKLVKPN